MIDLENNSGEVSRYNEAGLQILRLHNLWTKIELAINNGELGKWKYLLDSVWRELYADVFHLTKSDEIIKENIKFKNEISNSVFRTELYENLNKRHEFLKKLQDDCGKGGMYEDEMESQFE